MNYLSGTNWDAILFVGLFIVLTTTLLAFGLFLVFKKYWSFRSSPTFDGDHVDLKLRVSARLHKRLTELARMTRKDIPNVIRQAIPVYDWYIGLYSQGKSIYTKDDDGTFIEVVFRNK